MAGWRRLRLRRCANGMRGGSRMRGFGSSVRLIQQRRLGNRVRSFEGGRAGPPLRSCSALRATASVGMTILLGRQTFSLLGLGLDHFEVDGDGDVIAYEAAVGG